MKILHAKAIHFALRHAGRIARDKGEVSRVLVEARDKARASRGFLKGAAHDLFTLLELLRAWVRGEYRAAPWATIVAALAAVIYFLSPLDLIVDFAGAFGLVDDAFVITSVFSLIRKDVIRFEKWKAERAGTVVVS